MWEFIQENTGRRVKNEAGKGKANKGCRTKLVTPVDNWSLPILRNPWIHYRICLRVDILAKVRRLRYLFKTLSYFQGH